MRNGREAAPYSRGADSGGGEQLMAGEGGVQTILSSRFLGAGDILFFLGLLWAASLVCHPRVSLVRRASAVFSICHRLHRVFFYLRQARVLRVASLAAASCLEGFLCRALETLVCHFWLCLACVAMRLPRGYAISVLMRNRLSPWVIGCLQRSVEVKHV